MTFEYMCPTCGERYSSDYEMYYCSQCGERLREFSQTMMCPECGIYFDSKYRYCPYCGNKLNKDVVEI